MYQAAHIILAKDGEITCIVEGEQYQCKGILIPSNVKHTIDSKNTPVVIFLLVYSASFLAFVF